MERWNPFISFFKIICAYNFCGVWVSCYDSGYVINVDGPFALFVGELRSFYRITPIALIGGSLLPGLNGHNISEAAAAGCAVLTG